MIDRYQRPTWSGRHLYYSSHHPEVHEKCFVAGLVDRGLILSNPVLREKILKSITNTLIDNGYSSRLINSIKSTRIDKLYNSWAYQKRMEMYAPSSSNFTVIPYVEGLSERIQSLFRKHGVEVVFRVSNTTSRLFTRLRQRTVHWPIKPSLYD